jgi:S1-C subfamily serine protease
MQSKILATLLGIMMLLYSFSSVAELADILAKIKPAIVGIGVHTPIEQPQNIIKGSGFAIGNGHYVVTNYHVIPKELDEEKRQKIAVFIGSGKQATVVFASVVAQDEYHDIAILKLTQRVPSTLKLARNEFIREGSYVAFSGFPIGAVLGLYPVTHRGIISSITPVVIPVTDSRQMNVTMLKRLRNPYMVYQLDATAYPGNSGSALYDVKSGHVIGIINKVYIQASKESLISHPSGITYAIPVKHLIALLIKNNIKY